MRQKKVLGLAIGEQSLMAAEIVAGDRPSVARMAEFVYPPGVIPAHGVEFGKALGQFLRMNHFSAKAAVIGLPARWLVVKPKEVPPADSATLANLLRLQAEAEFSTELKGLVYDYAGPAEGGATRSVLLMATPQKHIAAAEAMCESARLNLLAVTPSALALGSASSRGGSGDSLVLSVASGGAELSAQRAAIPSAMRHLRGPTPQPLFLSDVRRAVTTLASNGTRQDMILWDGTGIDAAALGKHLGISVRSGDLPALGVDAEPAARNGEGRKFAAAVALGLLGVGGDEPAIDFLHSRLNPPKDRRMTQWMLVGALVAVVLIALGIHAYSNLKGKQAELDALNESLDNDAMKKQLADASAFVGKVSLAKGWHADDPRYLACLYDLTNDMPQDSQTYATSLTLQETPRTDNASGSKSGPKPIEGSSLTGSLSGLTMNQQSWQALRNLMIQTPRFTDVKLARAQDNGRSSDVAYTINFVYLPGKNP